jgi:hypothetical protein
MESIHAARSNRSKNFGWRCRHGRRICHRNPSKYEQLSTIPRRSGLQMERRPERKITSEGEALCTKTGAPSFAARAGIVLFAYHPAT